MSLKNALCFWGISIRGALVCSTCRQQRTISWRQSWGTHPRQLPVLFFLCVQSPQAVCVNVWLNKGNRSLLVCSYEWSSHPAVACYGAILKAIYTHLPQVTFTILCLESPSLALLHLRAPGHPQAEWIPLPLYFLLRSRGFPENRKYCLQLWTQICLSRLPDATGPYSTPLSGSQCGLWTDTVSITWELARKASSGIPWAQPYWASNSGVGPCPLGFHKPSRASRSHWSLATTVLLSLTSFLSQSLRGCHELFCRLCLNPTST